MMREQLRILLMTTKVLQFCATLFAVFGLILFVYFYFEHFSRNPLGALRDPAFIVTILIPFIPAAVLSWVVSRKRKEIRELIAKIEKEYHEKHHPTS